MRISSWRIIEVVGSTAQISQVHTLTGYCNISLLNNTYFNFTFDDAIVELFH
jgi:hypothetical protein